MKHVLHIVYIVLALLVASSAATAQKFSAQAQYLQCASFFAQGDLETARNACQLAVIAQPRFADALRLLSRIQLALEAPFEAQSALDQVIALQPANLENDLLGAEIAFAQRQLAQAEQTAIDLLQSNNLRPALQVRALKLAAKAAKVQGRNDETETYYQKVLASDPTDFETRRALANALLETNPDQAVALLQESKSVSPILFADLGRAQWIAGDLRNATITLEKAVSNPSQFSADRATYMRALGALAYSYYGQGRLTEGQRVLNQISGEQNFFVIAVNHILPWLFLMLVLLGLHLLGESRVEPLSTIEIQEGPRPWTVTNVYAVIFTSALLAGIAALLVGRLLFENFLAILTPVQSGVARDAFLSIFSFSVVLLSYQSARKAGWNTRELLIGAYKRDAIIDGAAIGLALVAVTLLYQFALHALSIRFDGFYLGLAIPRWTLVFPMLALPLTEVFFRAYASYPLEKRYGRDIAYPMLAVLYAVCLGAPIFLLVVSAVILMLTANRLRSTMPVVIAQLVYYVVLILIVSNIPIIRVWFF